MKGLNRHRYTQVVFLFFSATTVKRTIASTKEATSFSHEHIGRKEDSIYWSQLPVIKKEESVASTISVTKASASLSSSSSTSSWSELRYSLFANNDVGYEAQLKKQRLCDIGDGYIYHEDEIVGTFETKCGSVEEFPCYCAPDLDPPISCPYCGFHSEISNGNEDRLQQSKSEDFFCLQDAEISDPFVGSDKNMGFQQCSCSVEGDVPISSCHSANNSVKFLSNEEETTASEKPDDSPKHDPEVVETLSDSSEEITKEEESEATSEEEVCTLELVSGEIKIFQRGESYGIFLPSECQRPERFPCKCNPDLPDQIECPYCSFKNEVGNLVCAENEQTISFRVPGSPSRDVETCKCWVPEDPSRKPFQACTVTSYDMKVKEKDADHYYYAMSNESDESSNNSKPTEKGCDITDPVTGEIILVPIGDSFAKYLDVEGTCGNGIDWPAYCTADTTGTTDTAMVHLPPKEESGRSDSDAAYINDRKDIAYPYCVISDTFSGKPVCAKDDGNVVYTNSDGDKIQCSCQYSSSSGGQTVCSPYLPLPEDVRPTALKRSTSSGAEIPRSAPLYPTHSAVVSPTQALSIDASDAGVFIANGILRRTTIFVFLGHAISMIL